MPAKPDARPEFFAVLELAPPISVDDVKQAYLAKVKSVHPDHGGTMEDFLILQEAFTHAMEYAKFRVDRMKWLSLQVERYAAQEELVRQIEALGGEVESQSIDWIKRSFGEDFSQLLDLIVSIRLRGPQINNAVIELLVREQAALQQLHSISLIDTQVNDFGVLMLRAFQSLKRVDLSGSTITKESLYISFWLPDLQWLGLKRTRISWLSKLFHRIKNPRLKIG
jgi:hypothetical protein